MHKLISKYVNAYQAETGTNTEKVKKVLMHHAHSWEDVVSDTVIADLIDDTNIAAQDIVDYLSDIYEIEGGNEEFHYAVRALHICLRKAELAAMPSQDEDLDSEEYEEESFGYEHDHYLARTPEILHTMKY